MSKSPILKLAELLEMPDEQRQVIYRLGRRALEDGRVAEAIETLEVATQLSPHDSRAWRTLADAYRRGGYPGRADLHERFARELDA